MALTVQWASGFEEFSSLATTGSNQEVTTNNWLGWDAEYSTYTNNQTLPRWVGITTAPHLRGYWAYPLLQINSSNLTMIPRVFRSVVDNDKMVLGYAYCMKTANTASNRFAVGLKGVSGETIHVRPFQSGGVWRASLYINGTQVSTGTAVDIATGNPWVYIELVINKTAGTVQVRVSGVPECAGTMPVGFVASSVECTVGGSGAYNNGNDNGIDDMVFYVDSDPAGIIKVDGFYKTGDVMTGFADGTDNGSATTTGINSSSFSEYRASATVGSEDRFSYNNILPTGVQANSIIAVIPSVLASSGTYTNGNLELRFTSGATTTTTDVTTKVKPFMPQYIAGPVLHTDPNTSAAWTRANVQAIQTGYRVKA